MNEILEKINKIRTERLEYNYSNPTPIDENKIENFTKEFETFFNIKIDNDFLTFLKITDGIEDNGYKVYSSFDHVKNKVEYGIFQNNELWYEEYDKDREYIFFAESGSDLYVFSKSIKKYLLLDRYSGDVYKEYNSFNEMLLYILKLMLYEDVE